MRLELLKLLWVVVGITSGQEVDTDVTIPSITPSTTTTTSTTPNPLDDDNPSSPFQDRNGLFLTDNKNDFMDWLVSDVMDSHHCEYEGYDGWYNNPTHPELGSVDGPLIRLFPPEYADGVYQPSGQDRPNPFRLSEETMSGRSGHMSNTGKTAFLVFFGQQVVEEILDAQRPGCPPEYFNVPVPKTHEFYKVHKEMPLLRSRYSLATGNSPNNPRQQINEITPWLDGGLTYGVAKGWSDVLRSFKNGELLADKTKKFPAINTDRLPMANPPPPRQHELLPINRFFRLGNPRGNENPYLLTMGVMWFRWHNEVARALQRRFVNWTDERVYNEARKWVIATHQHIVVDEWLPEWLGDSLDEYKRYDGSIDPGIATVFQSAAMRFGHTLVTSGGYRRSGRSGIKRCVVHNTTKKTKYPDHRAVRTCNTFWNPREAVEEHDIDALIMGLSSQPCEREDNIIVEDLRGRVFGPLEFSRRDLMAVNIQRGRDHGLPDYNTARKLLNLKTFDSFKEMGEFCKNVNELNSTIFKKALPDLFANISNPMKKIDIWVGGILETESYRPGELFRTIIKDQFRRIRDGDRFWFQNHHNGQFTKDQINRIKNLNIYSIIWATTNIKHGDIQANPFRLPSLKHNTGLTPKCRVQLEMKTYSCWRIYSNGTNVTDDCYYLPPLNVSGKAVQECTPLKTFDYFKGSSTSYILSFLAIGLFAVGCVALLLFLGRKRQRIDSQIRKERNERIRKSLNENCILATEWEGPKIPSRQVVVQLLPTRVINVQLQNGKTQRTMDLRNVETLEIQVSITGHHLLVRVSKDYDLVLKFEDDLERNTFIEHLEVYLGDHGVGRQRREVNLQKMLKGAVTKADRQIQLEKFFRVVFSQAFDISHNKEEQLRMDATQAREIISTEITIFEFAEALSLRPDALFVKQIFSLVDKDNNGYISFREFLDMIVLFAQGLCLGKISRCGQSSFQKMLLDWSNIDKFPRYSPSTKKLGTPEEKMKLMFDMYDFDHSGVLTPPEFSEMIKSMLELANHSLKPNELDVLVISMFKNAGLNSKVDLQFQDFLKLMGDYRDQLGYTQLSVDVAGFQGTAQPMAVPHHSATTRAKASMVQAYRYSYNQSEISPEEFSRTSQTRVVLETTTSVERKSVKSTSILTQYTKYLENYRLHVFWQLLYGMVLFGIFIERVYFYWVEREHSGLRRHLGFWVSLTRGAASAIMFVYSTMLVTVCPNLITILRETFLRSYIPFDAAQTFHRVLACWGLLFTIIHTIGHAFNFYQVATQTADDLACLFRDYFHATDELPKFHYWAFGTITGLTGILAFLVLILMTVFATPYARRYVFGAFWATHCLYVSFYILTILHGAGQLVQRPFFYYFLLGPLCFFVIDKLISVSRKKSELSVIRTTKHPSDVIQIELKPPPEFNYKSGQWVRISTPVLNATEFHPFTLSSAPHEGNISLHIRAVGPWTRNFIRIFDPENIRKHAYPKIFLDGPFGEGHQDWFRFEVAVLVGGGIGVTPFASILKDVAQKSASGQKIPCKRLYFLWVTRTQKHFEWMTDIIRDVEEKDHGKLVHVHIFITQFFEKFDLRTIMLYICERHFQRMNNRSLFSGLSSKTHFGRPNIKVFFKSLRDEHPAAYKVGVFSCGPPPMTRDVQDACDELNKIDGAVFDHHFMNF